MEFKEGERGRIKRQIENVSERRDKVSKISKRKYREYYRFCAKNASTFSCDINIKCGEK